MHVTNEIIRLYHNFFFYNYCTIRYLNHPIGSQISNTGHILDSEEPKMDYSNAFDFYQ